MHGGIYVTIMVTGGAGYIGSHTVAELLEHGEEVVVIDNLGLGHEEAVRALNVPFYHIDIRDRDALVHVMRSHTIESVVHFAAYSQVGESVRVPLTYYQNNVAGTAELLAAMVEAGVMRIVFSSTAATYGEPEAIPIGENHPKRPTNPYGETKLAIERMLYWCYSAYGMQSISLRYFNAAGAHPTLPIGEHHMHETHLIPLLLQTALGVRSHFTVFGNDYPTADGSCIRDYIHVMDLASAHRLALKRLRHRVVGAEAFNLGIGTGYSVFDVIHAARAVTKREIHYLVGERRSGDPAVLVASSDLAKVALKWEPKYQDLASIIESAWNWHLHHPDGFRD